MNHFISGIIKIMVLEASAALLLVDRLLGEQYQKARRLSFAILAGLMVFAWCNYGALRGNFSLVHPWEQFHFYLGAKYQQEVGWFDLYKAALLADRTSTGVVKVAAIRDIETFELIPVDKALEDAARVRARFSDERWEEFKRDWAQMLRWPIDWGAALQDHGNSNSPAWALIAHPIAQLVPLNPFTQNVIGALDLVLMGVLWWFVYRTFDRRVASVGLLMWATAPLVFDYLAGSFLRWDWLFCLGMAMCFIRRGRWVTAGAFLGTPSRPGISPFYFGLALGLRAVLAWRRERLLPRRYVRFVVGTAASLALTVAASSAMFGGTWVWSDYKKRIDVARAEKFYSIQYSLRTVFLQVAESNTEELWSGWFFPRDLKQRQGSVHIEDHGLGFLVVQLLFSALVALLITRSDDVEAFALGPLLVFIWQVVNMYYWNMLGLLAMGLALRRERSALGALIGLHAISMVFYVYQHTNHGLTEGYIVALLLSVWLVVFPLASVRETKLV